MAKLTDELLMAYVDGELDAQTRAKVEAVLRVDAESKQRLAIFMQTGAPLAKLYHKPMVEPVPQHLVNFILSHNVKSTQVVKISPSQARPRKVGGWSQFWPSSLQGYGGLVFAAVAVLAVGVGSGWMMRGLQIEPEPEERNFVAYDQGRIYAGGSLQRVLETLPSGQTARLTATGAEGATMRANLTFKAKDKSYCREYEVVTPHQGGFAGVGCRDNAGRWALEVNVFTEASGKNSGQTIPAGANRNSAVDAVVDRLIDGDALGRSEEADALQSGWK